MTTDRERAQAAIRESWTCGAAGYDQDAGHGLATPAVERAWTAALQEALGSPPLDVLDAGTGTGLLAVLTARLGHRVTGIDLTPAMLERAHARGAEAGVRIDWREGDAAALPFPDSSFDAVISRHVLWTMTDPAGSFQDWVRVVRPGGLVVWFDGLERGGVRAALRQWAAGIVGRLQRRPDHLSDHGYTPEAIAALPFHGLRTTEPIAQFLRELGVDHVSLRPLPKVARAEIAGEPLAKRLAGPEPRYLGVFPVSTELKERVAR